MNNICNLCGTDLELVPTGKRKDGSTYKSFMGCPNWKQHPKDGKKLPLKTISKEFNFENYVADEFANLNKRLDGLAKYLIGKLGEE